MSDFGSTNYFDVKSLAGRLYRPTRFEFYIPKLPTMVNSFLNPTQERKNLQFAIQDVFFPGRNLASDTQKIAGPVDEFPYESVYSGDLDITVRVDGEFKEKLMFETWQDLVINQRTQNLNYPDSYRCEAFIDALDLNNKVVYQIQLTDVWPKTVGRVTVGQALTDSVATMVIGLYYRKYTVTHANENYQGSQRIEQTILNSGVAAQQFVGTNDPNAILALGGGGSVAT